MKAPDGEMESEEEEERMIAGGFHIVGTVSDRCEEDRAHVLEEYYVSILLTKALQYNDILSINI